MTRRTCRPMPPPLRAEEPAPDMPNVCQHISVCTGLHPAVRQHDFSGWVTPQALAKAKARGDLEGASE